MILPFEYYKRPFHLFHEEIRRERLLDENPHEARLSYWRLLPKASYPTSDGIDLVKTYALTVEQRMSEIVSRHSLRYWLHCYRRLSPWPIGEDKRERTTLLTRATVEATVQKYAILGTCDSTAYSNEVEVGAILSGLLLSDEFRLEKELIGATPPQLVLTSFTTANLCELYILEKLAFEIWKASAVLRGLGKGTDLFVDIATGDFQCEASNQTWRGVGIFDDRNRELGDQRVSSTGTIFPRGFQTEGTNKPGILLPYYNVGHIRGEIVQSMFAMVGTDVPLSWDPNFLWCPFELQEFHQSHKAFSEGFKKKYGVHLQTVLVVVTAICSIEVAQWVRHRFQMIEAFNRAYRGPRLLTGLIQDVQDIATEITSKLSWDTISEDELHRGIDFWTLKDQERNDIDLVVPGPHSILLPCDGDRMLVDFVWIHNRLHYLFVGVEVSDQNFKAIAFEDFARARDQALRNSELKAKDGSRKQVDVSFACGTRLVIAECKAVASSIGVQRGDPTAIRYRQEEVVSKSISQADEKAEWLAKNPVGLNYDVTMFDTILPIGLSPFVEYVPYEARNWWLSEDIPRMLTVPEMQKLANEGFFEKVSEHKCVKICR